MTWDEFVEEYESGTQYFNGAIIVGSGRRDMFVRDCVFHNCTFIGLRMQYLFFHSCELNAVELRSSAIAGLRLTRVRASHFTLSSCDVKSITVEDSSADRVGFSETNVGVLGLTRCIVDSLSLGACEFETVAFTSCSISVGQFARAAITIFVARRSYFEGTTFAKPGKSLNLSGSTLVNSDIRPLLDLRAKFSSACAVDFRTVIHSLKHPGLEAFLLASGMPAVFAAYTIACAKSISPHVLFSMLQSTFISFGAPDFEFASALNTRLRAEGVVTFFFHDDSIPGEELHAMMRRGVNEHDRVILICSKASLDRPGLLNELKETLRREAEDGGRSYLIPILLDNYLISDWVPNDPDLQPRAVRSRVAADFTDWRTPASFDKQIARLIRALKRNEGSGSLG